MRSLFLFVLVSGGLCTAACSSSPGTSSGSPLASVDAATPPPTASGACNGLEQLASKVKVTFKPEAAPPPKGGALSNGTFILSEVTRYEATQSASDYPDVITMRYEDGVANFVDDRTTSNKVTSERFTSTVATSGTTLTATPTCPSAQSPTSFEYTVLDNGFLWYIPAQGNTFVVRRFTRTP